MKRLFFIVAISLVAYMFMAFMRVATHAPPPPIAVPIGDLVKHSDRYVGSLVTCTGKSHVISDVSRSSTSFMLVGKVLIPTTRQIRTVTSELADESTGDSILVVSRAPLYEYVEVTGHWMYQDGEYFLSAF